MSGTIEGGKQAAATNKLLYGDDFYTLIGRKGGQNGRTGGFASEKIGPDGLNGRERAMVAGKHGGTISKRKKKEEPDE